jgi:acyl-CoA thioester hydrolase
MQELELTYRGAVYPWHCDHMGHMNVMWYTGKFDEASWSILAHLGLSRSYMDQTNHGLAALQQNITYKRELRAGDTISIRSGILDIQEKVIRIFHEMRNDETGEVAAFSTITGIYMDTVARKARAIPVDIANRIRSITLDESKLYWADTLQPQPFS